MNHAELHARHREVLPRWVSLYYDEPIAIASGSGRRVRDAQGVEYLDFFGGILTSMVGYDVPEIAEAIARQVSTGVLHTSTLYLIESQVALAERIAELSGIPDAKVFFTTSGTEANETALQLATTARRSNQVLAMRNSYHGRGFASLGITGNRSWRPSGFSPLQTSYLQGSYPYRSAFAGLSDEDYIAACVADLREVIATTTGGDIACLIAEPIQGVGGFACPPDGLFGAFAQVLREYDVPIVSDEVQTGWGRTGEHFWGYQAHGYVPDALTFAKGVGNGMSLGGVVGRRGFIDSCDVASISTFGGNPLTTAVGLAVLDLLVDKELQANAAERGAELMAALRPLRELVPSVGDVRGKGLMVGVELVDGAAPDPAAAVRALNAARDRGLLIGKGGLYGNVLRIAPALTVTADEIAEGAQTLASVLRETL